MMRSKGRGRGYFLPKLICQVCGKGGQIALQCYHRFGHDYQGLSHSELSFGFSPFIAL